MLNGPEKLRFKICVFGEFGVGRRNLALRFVKNQFLASHFYPGIMFHIKELLIDGINIILIINVFGHPIDSMKLSGPSYFKESSGGLMVFDLSNINSFENLTEWLEIFNANAESDTPIVLLGDKADLVDKREVFEEQILEFIEKYKIFKFYEVSAKTGKNVENAFITLATHLLRSKKDRSDVFY